MLVAAALSFAAGIYLEAFYSCPLFVFLLSFAILLPLIPFLIKRKRRLALFIMVLLFVSAGAVRLGIVTTIQRPLVLDDDKGLYDGIVVEASPATKIVKLANPVEAKDIKVLYRTDEGLVINDRVKIFGQVRELNLTFNNPHLFSWKWMKRLEGISYEIKGSPVSISHGTNYVYMWRAMLAKKIESSGAKYPGVLKALTIGDTTGLDEATKRLFLETGTSHILAISGSNIGIITAFFFFLARLLIRRSSGLRQRGDDIRFAALLSIPFALMFMITAGSSIPTIRATIMITFFMLALFFERGKHMVNTIAVSALIILLIYPHSLFSPSFQLTFMSVLFIVIATERFYPKVHIENKIVKWVVSSVIMTIAATLGTLPIVVYHFYGINPWSVIHNLIAIPLMCILAMPMSLTGLFLPWGEYILRLSGEIVNLTIYILEYLNAGYIFPLIRPTLFECLLYFCLILAPLYVKMRIVLAGLMGILLPFSAAYVGHVYSARFHNKSLCVNFIDVGLGDAALVEAPGGVRILIDGGGQYRGDYDVGKSVIAPILLSKRIRTLDYVINTHPHGDHLGGLAFIMKHFKVRHFVTGAYFPRESKFLDLLVLLRERNMTVETWKKGEHYSFPAGMWIDVLNPERDRSVENANNASLVFRINYGLTSFLLTGDIDFSVEEGLILSGLPLRSNIMKVPHHGSRFSNSFPFVRSVRPETAVLSVGKGIRGLPGDDALSTYKALSIPLLRTDQNGFIRTCSDGSTITCGVMYPSKN